MKIGVPYTPTPARRERPLLSQHAWRRKLGRRIRGPCRGSAVCQCDECRAVGPHGEARRRIRPNFRLRSLCAVLESRHPGPLPESAVRRTGCRRPGLPATLPGAPSSAESSRSKRLACKTPGTLNLGGSIATAGGSSSSARPTTPVSALSSPKPEIALGRPGSKPARTPVPSPTRAATAGNTSRSWPPEAVPFSAEDPATRWSRSRSRTFRRSRCRPLSPRLSPPPQQRGVASRSPGAFAPAVLPAGGEKALVDKTCGTGCHSVEVVTSQRMNAKDWEAIVQSMVARGARASDAEVKQIVDYLSKTLGR